MLLPLVGRNIAYDLVGPENGPVVAFSHSLAADSGMWAEQVPALVAAGYRALCVDLRGHGGSGAPPGPYHIDQLADDIVLVLDAIGEKQCHFVGLSIGGMIGQSLGIRGGGNSLDNTLRVVKVVPTEWVLVDVRAEAVTRGFGHGHLYLWSEDGTLMATASQSCIVRFWKGEPS